MHGNAGFCKVYCAERCTEISADCGFGPSSPPPPEANSCPPYRATARCTGPPTPSGIAPAGHRGGLPPRRPVNPPAHRSPPSPGFAPLATRPSRLGRLPRPIRDSPSQEPRPSAPRGRLHRRGLSPLRGSRLRLHPAPLPRLRPRAPPRLHPQVPSLLPLLPPTPRPGHQRMDRPCRLPRRPPPPVRLHHPQGPPRHLPQTPRPPHHPLPHRHRVPPRPLSHPPQSPRRETRRHRSRPHFRRLPHLPSPPARPCRRRPLRP